MPFQLEYLDMWQTPSQQFANSGDPIRLRFTVTGGARLRICLFLLDAVLGRR